MSDSVIFRRAVRADLEQIVAMFADDELGRMREDPTLPLDQRYTDAFDILDGDTNQFLLVGEQAGGVVAYLQITFIQHLSRLGGIRGQIESVRVALQFRGQGLGSALTREAIRLCAERRCSLVQLTTDVTREKTKTFYERLGFVASHHGMKLAVVESTLRK